MVNLVVDPQKKIHIDDNVMNNFKSGNDGGNEAFLITSNHIMR